MVEYIKKPLRWVKQKVQKNREIKNQAFRQYNKFKKYSLMEKSINDAEYVIVNMRVLTHDLEKGFSLPKPKKGFGREKVQELDKLIKIYEKSYWGIDDQAYSNGMKIIRYYISKANEFDFDVSFIDMDKYLKVENYDEYGYQEIETDVLANKRKLEFGDFAKSRHSIRKYKEGALNEEDIVKALNIAKTAPSACNRQAVKVFHVTGKSICEKILDIQWGAKGFSRIEDLFIITSDLSCYMNLHEANTCFVDAGLFAMNFMNALHYLGIGSCPLLWNDESVQGEKIRKVIRIPEKNEIVLLISAGYYPEGMIKYAASVRKEVRDIYEKVTDDN